MWDRSSLRSLLVASACACGHAASGPEADPAQIKSLAVQMIANMPMPAALPACTPADLAGPDISYRTLRTFAGLPLTTDPEQSDWVNPTALEVAPARVLAEPASDATAQREAAGQLLAANAWIIHRVQFVGAPLALGVKELKIGTVNTAIIRFDAKTARPTCVQQFAFQNTKATSDWAISVCDKPYVDKRVQQVLRDDLAAQYLKLAPRGTRPKS